MTAGSSPPAAPALQSTAAPAAMSQPSTVRAPPSNVMRVACASPLQPWRPAVEAGIVSSTPSGTSLRATRSRQWRPQPHTPPAMPAAVGLPLGDLARRREPVGAGRGPGSGVSVRYLGDRRIPHRKLRPGVLPPGAGLTWVRSRAVRVTLASTAGGASLGADSAPLIPAVGPDR